MIPLWERLLTAAIGPVVAAILAFLVVNRFSDRAARMREEYATRDRLIKDMIETAQSLYLATQAFWRIVDNLNIKREDRRSSPKLVTALGEIDKAYYQSRVKIAVIEGELRHRFKDLQCQVAWHAVDDLLTVRYFQLVEPDEQRLESIYDKNRTRDGVKHSGLSVEELRKPSVLLETYRNSLSSACELVRTADLAVYGHSGRAA